MKEQALHAGVTPTKTLQAFSYKREYSQDSIDFDTIDK